MSAERRYPDNWMQTYSGRRFWPLEPRAEEKVLETIYDALDIAMPTFEEQSCVKDADNRMLAAEKLVLHKPGHPWALPEPYTDVDILCWDPKRAEMEWLEAYTRQVRTVTA